MRQSQQAAHSAGSLNFQGYATDGFYDELIDRNGRPRSAAALLLQRIEELPEGELLQRQQLAERALFRMGITFAVYGDTQGVEKIFPFDILPRIVAADEWAVLERGLKQRIRALNLFLDDVYHDQQFINEGILPREILQERLELP